MKILELKSVLPVLFKAHVTPLLWGNAGIGKTEAVSQYTNDNGMEIVTLNLGTQEVGDLLGLPDFENGKTDYRVPSWFPTDPNSKGVLFLDEINRARRDVLQAVFSLVLEKRIHTRFLPKGWSVVAAANPYNEDHVVTDISDQAFMSRFCHIRVQNDMEEWVTYATSVGTPNVITAFAQEQKSLFQDKNFDLPRLSPRFRSLSALGRVVNTNELPENLLFEVATGILGMEAGVAFMSHRKEYQHSVKGSDVLNNFKKVKAKVEELSKQDTRLDSLNITCGEVFNEVTTMEKIRDKVKKNLFDFIFTIPKDLAASLCFRLLDHDTTRDMIGNDDTVVDYFKKNFNMDEIKALAKQFEEKIEKAA